jgi:ABC-type transport system involved in multi-copper enzyme maturation permease subunit
MSTAVSVAPPTAVKLHDARPSFVGIVRGELFKVSRQLATWIFAVLYVGGIGLTYLIDVGTSFKDSIGSEPTWAIYKLLGVDMTVLKIFGGAFIILVATRLIGMEYSGGTIRVLLSRGVGRLQLLFGKLAALTIIALILVAVTLLLDLLLTVILLLISVGNINLLTSAPSGFWADSWTYLLLALVSVGVTLLMATAVTVLSRSLAVGMAVGMLWYPAENMSIIFLILGFRLTNSDFWRLLSGDFLGLNLNAMPTAILPERAVAATNVSFTSPLVPVTGGHTLLVVAIFAVVFAAVSIILTARRDVKE